MSESFEYIKELLITPTVLQRPTTNHKFRLERGINKTAARAVLFEFLQGQWEPIGNHLMKLPQAVQNYGITELELTGLVCNKYDCSQLLKDCYFDVLVDDEVT